MTRPGPRLVILAACAAGVISACGRHEPASESALALGASSAHAATLLNDDGEPQAVVVAGIRGPDPDLAPDAAETSRSALNALISNTQLSTLQIGAPDRYERIPVQITLADQSDVAEQMIRSGHALVWPREGQEVDFDRLIGLERIAREQGTGHWAGGVFVIRDSDPNRLAPFLDSAQIIEGRVIATGENREGRLYLNFGLDWRTDLTISASPEVRARFEAQGLHLESLEGAVIRARGWLYAENGPMIALTHRAQLEIIDAPSARAIPR